MDAENHYSLLGVEREATSEAIRMAYVTLRDQFLQESRRLDDPDFQQIKYAYEVLSDPKRRSIYDSLLGEIAEPVLQVALLTSRQQIGLSETEQIFYLRLDIRPTRQDVQQLPLNLCLVLDRSTSMQGIRLQRMQTAVEQIVKKLGPADVLSIVSFSDRAEAVVVSGNIIHLQSTLGKIRTIHAAGGTEIYQGLKEAVAQLKRVDLAEHNNHLILLTDGHTYGDAEACLELAQETAVAGINITAFGLGAEWNDTFLDNLVAPSGGLSSFIETPGEIIDYLQNRIQNLGKVYAKNVRLKQDFPHSLALQYGFKLTPFAQPLPAGSSGELNLGDIEGRSPLSVLLEFAIQPQTIPTRINIPITLTADILSQQLTKQTFSNRLQLFVLSKALEETPPKALVEAVRLLNLYRMNEKVWEELGDGRIDTAVKRMRHLTTRLLEAGQSKLAHQAHLEAERLANVGSLSHEGRKKLKYGTRTLMSQTMRLDLE